MKLGLMSSEFRRELIEQINAFLRERDEILAAYLFGSAAEGGPAVNDIDILVLMNESDTDANLLLLSDLDLDLVGRLRVSRDRIDLIPLDSRLVQPEVLFDALKTGILLKCSHEEKLTDAIEDLSRYFLENEELCGGKGCSSGRWLNDQPRSKVSRAVASSSRSRGLF